MPRAFCDLKVHAFSPSKYHQSMAFQVEQIVGEYKILRALGRGGLGAVYEAVHLISQRSEAIKVLISEETGTVEMTERFRREIQLVATLNHPNIAGLHNAFYFEGQLVMVMELVEGEDLRSLSRRTRIPIPMLMDCAVQVLTALEYAHARGVVHRDIKPANIMVSPAGLVKVLDFGIAITERSTDLTVAGSVIGSPTHMSPEQIRGEKASPQSDIYSLGVSLYELIAGQPPIQGANTYELMMGHLHRSPAPLRELRPDIPAQLCNAISRSLEKEPEKRFATANEFLAALRAQDIADAAQTTSMSPAATWQRVNTDEVNKPSTAMLPQAAEALTQHLAAFIGPIAKIVVGRLAKENKDIDQLYAEAAKQIDNEAERRRFLQTRPPR